MACPALLRLCWSLFMLSMFQHFECTAVLQPLLLHAIPVDTLPLIGVGVLLLVVS